MKAFISYSSKDKPFARRLAIDLEEKGIEIWFDEWELKVGDSLIDELEKGLQQSDYVIAVLSPNSIDSKWAREELKSALTKSIATSKTIVLPALYKDCDIPIFLVDRIYADFRGDYLVGLNSVVRAIKSASSSLPRSVEVKIEQQQSLTRDDLVILQEMVSDGRITLNKETLSHILTSSLLRRCNFAYWYEFAKDRLSPEALGNLVKSALPFSSDLFPVALEIALCDDAKKAMEMLYRDLGIKSIGDAGHVPLRFHAYLRLCDLLEYLARIPTPTVVKIFVDDMFCAFGDYKFFGLRYATITREPLVLSRLFYFLMEELEELARERIVLVLTEQLADDEFAQLFYSHLNTIREKSHIRARLIQVVNILPPGVRLHLLSICLDDEYRDIKAKARESIFEYEKALFVRLGYQF